MKDQHFVPFLFEYSARVVDTFGGIAELTGHDQWLVRTTRHFGFDHAADGPRRAGENLARDAIKSCHIDDARKENDVLDPDVLRRVPAGESRDHDLGKTDRQRSHGRRADGRAAAATQRDNAIDLLFRDESSEQCWRSFGHRSDRLPTIFFSNDCGQIDSSSGRNLLASDVRL